MRLSLLPPTPTRKRTRTRILRPTDSVPLCRLRFTDTINPNAVIRMTFSPPVVIAIGRFFYILDGNHRAILGAMAGLGHVPVWVLRRGDKCRVDPAERCWTVDKWARGETTMAEIRKSARAAYRKPLAARPADR